VVGAGFGLGYLLTGPRPAVADRGGAAVSQEAGRSVSAGR
jgi:hypothetical protein